MVVGSTIALAICLSSLALIVNCTAVVNFGPTVRPNFVRKEAGGVLEDGKKSTSLLSTLLSP